MSGKPLRRVAIVGVGTTKFKSRGIDKTSSELADDAAPLAREKARR